MDFNFHEAETESDSDDNLSTQDAQRSVQTGATHGSDTGEDCATLPKKNILTHTPPSRVCCPSDLDLSTTFQVLTLCL